MIESERPLARMSARTDDYYMGAGDPVISMQITTVGRFKPDKALRSGPI